MADFSDNQLILNAILGTGALTPQTTFNTGFDFMQPGQQSGGQPGQMQSPFGGQLPTMGNPLDSNPSHSAILQYLGSVAQPNQQFSNFRSPQRHAIGRDAWQSHGGLDHESIMNNLGLGRR